MLIVSIHCMFLSWLDLASSFADWTFSVSIHFIQSNQFNTTQLNLLEMTSNDKLSQQISLTNYVLSISLFGRLFFVIPFLFLFYLPIIGFYKIVRKIRRMLSGEKKKKETKKDSWTVNKTYFFRKNDCHMRLIVTRDLILHSYAIVTK